MPNQNENKLRRYEERRQRDEDIRRHDEIASIYMERWIKQISNTMKKNDVEESLNLNYNKLKIQTNIKF